MRVTCPYCRSKAIITSSNELSDTAKDLYCQCLNTKECGASFVSVLAFKHALNPPAKTTLQIAANLIMSLNSSDRKKLQVDLFC